MRIISKRRFASFVLVSVVIGIALGHLRYLDKWVYFPLFPNVFDVVATVLCAVLLLVLVWRKA